MFMKTCTRLLTKDGIKYLQCYTCSKQKLLTNEFFRPRKAGKLGFLGVCRDCLHAKAKEEYIELKINNSNKLKESRKRTDDKRYDSPNRTQYRKRYSRHFYLMGTYNMTLEDYENLKNLQNNRCAICGGEGKGRWKVLDVDHNHKTGKIRGLLCNKCNSGMGLFQDDAQLLKNAFNYLKEMDGD